MAVLTVTIDDTIKADCDSAFLASFANPDSLTADELTELHVKNFLKGVLNDWYMSTDVDAAKSAATQIADIETGT